MAINRFLSAIILMIYLFLPNQVAAGNGGAGSLYLSPPAVTWQGDLISGDLKSVPVQGLVEDLLRSEGYEWDVDGQLQGQISISFDALTSAESIRRILKRSDVNFAMILSDAEPSGSGAGADIEELTIYQKDGYVRFSRTSRKITASDEPRQMPTIPEPRFTATQRPPNANPQPIAPTKQTLITEPPKAVRPADIIAEERAMMERDFKAMFDEKLAEKEITEEEYRKFMKELDIPIK